ncbi:hypothetical protein [Mesorhizobium sp. M1B.F.Ca.ET.045.04.1.1]|uniref:hypothetical protein n=1 Tax=Mesorhizobium sp. M1B.F.Ca.ET.045.04.1.1 TaxID=2493673 RepID=UPI000F74F4B0|nr:hypothetical protein [Mesorhizobium sp. M1B.F.Ca.ET.045.04.1.1]AZO29804.1 hypothetical protein EJ071_21975 [Mesorhizobium sp. M1B.F.Ca.ET.045.04.1.1]
MKAEAAWNRLKPDLARVLAALARWNASDGWTKDGGRYIPHPTTWLNREGWNDVVPGETPSMSAADMAAAQKRTDEAKAAHEAQMAALARKRSDELLGVGK